MVLSHKIDKLPNKEEYVGAKERLKENSSNYKVILEADRAYIRI